jgi:hypothetical protein
MASFRTRTARGRDVPFREFSGTVKLWLSQLNRVDTVTGPSVPKEDAWEGRLSFWYLRTGYRSIEALLLVGRVRLTGLRPMLAHANPFKGTYLKGGGGGGVVGKQAR